MKCALFPRFAFNVAVLMALVAAPRFASATILVPAAGAQEAAVHKAAATRNPARARVSHVVDVAAPQLDLRAAAPAVAGRQHAWPLAPDAEIPPSQAWLWALLAGALIGLGLLANSRFACSVLGHRRSKQGLRFESREHQWVSTCRRCKVELCRDAFGVWLVASDARDKSLMLKPVAREAGGSSLRAAPAPAHQNGGHLVSVQVPSSDGEPQVEAGTERDATGAHVIVAQLLDEVLGGKVAPPGARGALFFVVDQLRGRPGMDEQARLAEEISVEIQHLQSALQRGAEEEAALARRQLGAAAGEWMRNGPRPEPR